MPISLTPSRRSQKTWGNLSSHPIRYDISALALAQLALIFNLATAAWDAGNQHNTMYRWSSGLMSLVPSPDPQVATRYDPSDDAGIPSFATAPRSQ